MKTNILVLFCVFWASLVFAQEPKKQQPVKFEPPKEIDGFKVRYATLSKGKYQEIFTNDTIQQIGSVYFNRVTGEVVGEVERDSLYFPADVSSRWWSVDPLAEKFPEQSPYVFVLNNPLRYNDPDGREPCETGDCPDAIQQVANSVAATASDILVSAYNLTIGRLNDTRAINPDGITIKIVSAQQPSSAKERLLNTTGDLLTVGGALTGVGNTGYLFAKTGGSFWGTTLGKLLKKQGKDAEDLVQKQLAEEFSENPVLKQVTGEFGDGTTTIIDHLPIDPKTGKPIVVETKSGGAKLSNQQKRLIKDKEEVTLKGKNAGNLEGSKITKDNKREVRRVNPKTNTITNDKIDD